MATLLVMLVLLASAVSTASSFDRGSQLYICDQLITPYCECSHFEEDWNNYIHCKHPETGLKIYLLLYSGNGSVYLQCQGYIDSTYSNGSTDTRELSMMSGLQIGVVNSLNLIGCPFIDSSIEELMTNIGVLYLKILNIESYTFKDKLKKKHFQHLYHVGKLTLNYNGITSLPSDIFEDMRNLVYLELQNNYLSHLPQGIFNYSRNLEEIDLKDNNFHNSTCIDSGVFKHLHSLKKLHLSGNCITNLTKALFSDVQNLESLDLDAAQMETVEPHLFSNLKKLKTLSFYTIPFFSFSKDLLSKNTELEELKIYGNKKYITLNENKTSVNLPSGFLANLFNLKVFKLSGLGIKSLPEDIFNGAKNIKKICLSNNLLITMPENIFINLKELEYLDLSQNKIANLPEDLFKANIKLKALNMNHNILKKIPRNLLVPLNLEFLDISYNELCDIRESIIRCPDLKVVNLSNNRLTSLSRPLSVYSEPYSFLSSCLSLENLQLANNSLTEMYNDWRYIPYLHTLNLSFNSIPSVSINGLHFDGNVTIELSNNNISQVSIWDPFIDFSLDITHGNVDRRITRITASLYNNPFNCDCKLQPFVQFLQTQQISFDLDLSDSFEPYKITSVLQAISIPSNNLTCHEPKTLQDEKLSSVDQNLLICELNSGQPFDEVPYACPDNCSCHYRAVDRANVFNCSNTPLYLPLVNKANHSELILRRSQLTKFHLPEGNGYENLRRLDLSHNNLTEFSIPGISTIQDLHLSYNNLNSIDMKTIDRLETSPLMSIVLHNNSWLCDCENVNLLRFIQGRYYQLKGQYNVTCYIQDVLVPIIDVHESDMCSKTELLVIMVIFSILLFIFIVVAILCYFFPVQVKVLYYSFYWSRHMRWLVPHQVYDASKEYDAFISYANEDEEFVNDTLVPLLENHREGIRLILHYRDWIPGENILDQIIRSVNSSRRTIVVLSPNYIRSVWGIAEFNIAHSESMTGSTKVIVILYQDVASYQIENANLRVYLNMITYLQWGSKWFTDQLLHALPRPPVAERDVGYQNGQVRVIDDHNNE